MKKVFTMFPRLVLEGYLFYSPCDGHYLEWNIGDKDGERFPLSRIGERFGNGRLVRITVENIEEE